MRIHVALLKPTTVSVDDEMMGLLGAVLVVPYPACHASADEQLRRARRFVQAFAKEHRHESPDGFSRLVQRAILRRIVAPQALTIFDARDSEEAKAQAKAADEAMGTFGMKQLSAQELAGRKRAIELRKSKREQKKTDAAIAEVRSPEAKVSHADFMRAGEALLSRPGASLR